MDEAVREIAELAPSIIATQSAMRLPGSPRTVGARDIVLTDQAGVTLAQPSKGRIHGRSTGCGKSRKLRTRPCLGGIYDDVISQRSGLTGGKRADVESQIDSHVGNCQ